MFYRVLYLHKNSLNVTLFYKYVGIVPKRLIDIILKFWYFFIRHTINSN